MSKEKTVNLERIFGELGDFGRFQITNYLFLMLPIFFSAVYNSQYVFTAAESQYRCKVDQCEESPPKFEAGWWASFALPPVASCQRYAPLNDSCQPDAFNSTDVIGCDTYVYDNFNSIVSEFELGCQEWKRTLVGTVHSAGLLVGLPFCGYLSDTYGRRAALIVTSMLTATMGIIRSFAPDFTTFLVFEFLDATVGTGSYSTGFILALEMVGMHRRVLGGNVISSSFAMGQVVLALVTWALPYWRHLLRALYAPSFLFIFYYFLVEESVRWLLSVGRKKEAAKIIFKAAELNKKKLSPQTLEELSDTNVGSCVAPTEPQPSVIAEVVKSRVIMTRFLICSFWWIAVTFTYYGLSITSVSLAGNMYVNFMLTSLVEIPGYAICVLCLDRFGRKLSLMSSFTICGIALIALPFTPNDQPWMAIALNMIGKMCISGTFSGIYIYTSELFPTQARHRLLASCSMLGRIGLLVAPQTPLLAAYMPSLPYLLFGSVALCSAGLMVFTPDTLGRNLPDTVHQAEDISEKPGDTSAVQNSTISTISDSVRD